MKELTEAIKEAIWIDARPSSGVGLRAGGTHGHLPGRSFNTSAIRLSDKIGSEARTRHIVNRLNFIREEIEQGTVVLEYIPTGDMVADILAGPRERGLFEYLRKILLEGHTKGKRSRALSV